MEDELRIPLTTRRTGSSVWKACFNGTNAFLGIGLLTVPYALSSGGWLSLSLLLLVAIMTFYTGLLLKRCMDTDSSIKTYVDIAEHAFGKNGKIIVIIVMNSELYLVAVGLLILEGDNLCNLFPDFMVKIGTLTIQEQQSFVIITALVILPSMLLLDLSILSYVSATGVFSCVIILCSIVCVGVFGSIGFSAKGTLLNLESIPTAISLYIVCFAGHPVVPTIYTSMQDTRHFSKVLLFSFVLTAITYTATAVVSYLMYGEDVESLITLNLPTNVIATQVAIYTTLLIPITRYALMVTPVATAIEGGFSENIKSKKWVRLMIRIVLLISTVIIAYVFPYYESLMAIVGSIFVVLASFVFPCLFYLNISGIYRSWNYELVAIVGVVLFGIAAGVLGTYSSVSDLM